MTVILTHRGLEPSRQDPYAESSVEAFGDHLRRGFGLEFDPNYLGDDTVVVTHDLTLKRITGGKDSRALLDIDFSQFEQLSIGNGHLGTLRQLLTAMTEAAAPLHALHLKGVFQEERFLTLLVKTLRDFPDLLPKLLMFDVKPHVAEWIKVRLPDAVMAPSVAHSFDVARYNSCVFETLLTPEEALSHRNLYGGVWLDEWDLSAPDDGQKMLYTEETIEMFRREGLLIGLVTPELHGTSPGLLGGEAHPDAKPFDRLMERIEAILALKPDAVCTDYPEEVLAMLSKG